MADPIPMPKPSPVAAQRTMSNASGLTQDVAAQTMRRAFGLFIGAGRMFSIEAVASATEIPERTLRSYQSGEATPGLANLFRIIAVLPPEFANELLMTAGMTGARRVDGPAKSAGVVLAETAGFVASLSKKLADDNLNHIESMELRREVGPLIADLQNLQAQLGRESA